MTATTAICQKVMEAVSETFETMIFTQVALWNSPPSAQPESHRDTTPAETTEIPVATETPSHHSKCYWTRIPVLSPVEGTMLMQIPASLAVEITKNLYGWMDDSELTETVEVDAIAELINTISGRLMVLLLPEDQSFELGLPETSEHPLDYLPEATICRFASGVDTFSFILSGSLASL